MRLACAWKKSGFDCCEAESVEKPWKTWIQSALFRWMCRFQIFPYQVAFAKHLFLKFGIYPRKFPRQFPSVMRWSLIVTIVFPFFVAAKVHSCNGHCGTFEKDEHLLLQRKNGRLLYVKRWIQGRGFFRRFSGFVVQDSGAAAEALAWREWRNRRIQLMQLRWPWRVVDF